MMRDRKWKLGDDLSRIDSILDGVSFEDLIFAVHHNCKTIEPEAVKDMMIEIIDQRLTDTWFLIENNMEEIIEAASEGRGNKTVVFLKDIMEDAVDAVIVADTSTKEEIQDAINRVKADNDEYQWEDLVEGLPEDCKVYDRWSSKTVYY